jgi:hypothetical protein
MSLFFISNDRNKTLAACEIWNEQGFISNSYCVTEDIFCAISEGVNKKAPYIEKNTNTMALSLGTFFTESTFSPEKIFSSIDMFSFCEATTKQLFGHYVFILFSKNTLRIVTDPVGLISVYFSQAENDFNISNDPSLLAGLSGNCELSQFGAQQFLLNESTSCGHTLFKGVKRLTLGFELVLENSTLWEKRLYSLDPEVLTLKEYMDRISVYFSAINNYPGRIATELSAGFDTRLIAACASKFVDNLTGITNQNKFDGGVDEEVARIVAKFLDLDVTVIERPNDDDVDKSTLLHMLLGSRDIERSVAWPEISKRKYEHAELILGGYGGESLRAKYCHYSSIENFVLGFYNGNKIEGKPHRDDYLTKFTHELRELFTNNNIKNMPFLCNYIYSLDRMRIWGGGGVNAMMFYGDRLHPFMDWYLLNPVLNFSTEELKGGRLQAMIIENFVPELMNIAINPRNMELVDQKGMELTTWSSKLLKIKYFVFEKYKKLKNLNDKKNVIETKEFQDDYKELCQFLGMKVGTKNNTTRLATIDYSLKVALSIYQKYSNK